MTHQEFVNLTKSHQKWIDNPQEGKQGLIRNETIFGEKAHDLDLSEIVCENVIFEDCDFENTIFSHSKFKNVIFKNCDLTSTIFDNSNLEKTEIQSCNCLMGLFREAEIVNSKFIESKINQTDFCSAKIYGTIFRYSDIKFSYFSKAEIEDTIFSCSEIEHTNFGGVGFYNTEFSSCSMSSINFVNTDLNAVTFFEDTWGAGINLSGAQSFPSTSDFIEKHFEATKEGIIVYKTFGTNYPIPKYWTIEPNSVITEVVNFNKNELCGCGINVAPYQWVLDGAKSSDYIYKLLIKWEWLAGVCVPFNSTGQIRCEKAMILEKIENER